MTTLDFEKLNRSYEELSVKFPILLNRMAEQEDVKSVVEQNHDNNRWWPNNIEDWRLRMLVAGWSTRVSFNMVDKYAGVVNTVSRIGFDRLTTLPKEKLREIIRPIGLADSRISYFYSLQDFFASLRAENIDPLDVEVAPLIFRFASQVKNAQYKVAQCAILYSRGYHSGIIPVDSGMVTRLGPLLGLDLSRGPIAHEEMRYIIERCVKEREADCQNIIKSNHYKVSIPDGVAPTWWVHLVLIYFKRLYCNRPNARLCKSVPTCQRLLDCGCPGDGD